MRITQLRTQLDEITVAVTQKVRQLNTGGKFARGLASEGYMGGYLQALYDVALAANDVEPDRWRQWRTERKDEEHDS